jgi:transposase
MPAPYPIELRHRIVDAYTHKEGSVRALAKRFAVAPETVRNYLNLVRRTGSVAPRPHGGGVKPRIELTSTWARSAACFARDRTRPRPSWPTRSLSSATSL